jgi:hypothetical protein
MIVGRASGSHFIPARNSPKSDTAAPAGSAELPEECNRFLGTQNCAHLAGSILSDLGGEADPAALAMACFQEVAKP